MRTFLLFLPLLLLKNELFVGALPAACSRANDDVDDENDDDELSCCFFRRGSELLLRLASLTFSFTLNIVLRASLSLCFVRLLVSSTAATTTVAFQCQQVSGSPLLLSDL